MTANYCSNCGEAVQEGAKFCGSCGNALTGTQEALPHIIPVERVMLMTVLSGGLYIFYWFYLTWKHYRDYSGLEVYPVWHALTLFVPIYGLFRTHAHFRTYAEIMSGRDIVASISPGKAVVIVFIANIATNISLRMSFGEITQAVAIFTLIADIIFTVFIFYLLTNVQKDFNRYWRAVTYLGTASESSSTARIGAGEIIIAILGILVWIDTIVTVTSESYRLGF